MYYRSMLFRFILLYAVITLLPGGSLIARQGNVIQERALPGVVSLALREPLPDGAALRRAALPGLEHTLQSLQIHTLAPIAPAPRTVLHKNGHRTRIDNLYNAWYAGGRPPEEVAKILAGDPAVEFAEARYYYTLTAMPDDPLAGKQWYLDAVQLPRAWEIAKAEQGGVVIAIIDGGTDISHPDLVDNLWTNPGEIPANGLDDDNNGYADDLHGYNFTNNIPDPASLFSGTSYSDHGTHTAGAACATADNRLGIAGTSWNARLMALNAGSKTTDKNIDPLSIDKAIAYATANGADILSCSFSGSYSEITHRLIRYAFEEGLAIVAAAGNANDLADQVYPASYNGVLAVAATDSTDSRAYFSNYGYSVDVTAPGVSIWSTVSGDSYAGDYWQGTSMSTPIAAGVVALVMTRFPEWSGLQAAEQVRVTADNIDARNPSYAGKLGRGRINAWRALTEIGPSLRITGCEFFDQDGDRLIEPGETVRLRLAVTNYLTEARNVTLALSEESPYTTVSPANAALASIGSGESIVLDNNFAFKVGSAAPSNHPIDFTLSISAGGYTDTDHFTLTVLPAFANIGVNNIYTTVTNVGRIGSADPGGANAGIGFLYKSGANLLFEGAIIAGTSANRIVNAARGLITYTGAQENDADFIRTEEGDIRITTPGSLSDQESITSFSDAGASSPLNIRITQQTFASSDPRYADLLFLSYRVHNLSGKPIDRFHFGLFCDWDMDAGSYNTNVAAFDADRRLGYACDSGDGPATFAGIRLLTPGGISYRAIINDNADPLNPGWGLHDGFTDGEKWEAISGGVTQSRVGPADISNVIASGPHIIPAGGEITIDFALIAADNLELLQAAADSARMFWLTSLQTGVESGPITPPPAVWALEANYPNPFNAETTILFSLPRPAPVRLDILDLSGRLVRRLAETTLPAGRHRLLWDGRDNQGRSVAGGTYLYRLQSDGEQLVRKLVLLR